MELNEIVEQVKQVIQYSQNYRSDIELKGVEPMINDWYEAKQYFINAFGGPIYEVPGVCTFELDEQTQTKNFERFVHAQSYKYGYVIMHDWCQFMEYNGAQNFYSNVVGTEYEYNGKKIVKGMRLLRAFSYFINDETTLDNLQTEASVLIQENKVKGHLCFSVHPLDYLSSSETTLNWRSCHSLDGEYRSGNLSYMMDKSTIVCYLKTGKDVILPHFPDTVPWNNKKWRMLLFLADEHNAFYAGRQYPFTISNILNRLSDYLFPLLKFNADNWSPWRNEYITSVEYNDGTVVPLDAEYVCIKNHLYKRIELIHNGDNSLQYNDLLNSSIYKNPWYRWRDTTLRSIHFTIGHQCNCPQCGLYPVKDSETMLCKNCLLEDPNMRICDCCGEWHNQEDLVYVESDDCNVCGICLEEEYERCTCCNEIFRKDNMIIDEDCNYYCEDCWNNN